MNAARPPVHDAHAHFFSHAFYAELARQTAGTPGGPRSLEEVARTAGVEVPPEEPAVLADRWVEEMERHGVASMVLMASIPGDAESVLGAARRHPTRIVPYALFHPLAPGAVPSLEAAAADGLRGACLFPSMHGYAIDQREVQPFLRRAAELRQIVLVHCGLLQVGLRRKLGLPHRFPLHQASPLSVSPVALEYAETPFVLPHFGAGFFREALLLGAQCDNVFLDTSSSNSWRATQPEDLSLNDVFRRALGVFGAGRLLFGSDSNVFPRGLRHDVLELQDAVLHELALPAADRAAILGGNLRRLLGGSA